MTPATSLAPRRRAEPAPPIRTSAHALADIEATTREAEAAAGEVARLNGLTNGILLSGNDEAHELHLAEIGRLQRIVARAEARHAALTAERRAAEEREAEEQKARQRVEAEAAVAAVLAKVEAHYTVPAARIAAFLAEWDEAGRIAAAARIPGPDAAVRRPPSTRAPDREVSFTAYVDEQGNPTQNQHPYRPDGLIDRSRVREQRTFHRTEPGPSEHRRTLPPLSGLVRLPHYGDAGDHHRGERVRDGNRWE